MITTFSCKSAFTSPSLHVWRRDGTLVTNLRHQGEQAGWFKFILRTPRPQEIHFKLFEEGAPPIWEQHDRFLAMPAADEPGVWFMHGSSRVIDRDPSARGFDRVRVHLVTAGKYKNGSLYLWTPRRDGRTIPLVQEEETLWGAEVDLSGEERNVFNFVFLDANGQAEAWPANRTWCSGDGREIWTHSEAPEISRRKLERKNLTVHYRHDLGSDHPAKMHIWQEGYGFQQDIPATGAGAEGWESFSADIYSGVTYGFMFRNEQVPGESEWERPSARRYRSIEADAELWTFDGHPRLFSAKPAPAPVEVRIAEKDPSLPIEAPDALEVRIGDARAPLPQSFWNRQGEVWRLSTYPDVETLFRFRWGELSEKKYHRLRLAGGVSPATQHVVLGRGPLLSEKPPQLFADPPFVIRRPGAYEEEGMLRFVLHSPWSSRVRLRGEWMAADEALDLRSTKDGAYWWGQVPVTRIKGNLPPEFGGDYHSSKYRFELNDTRNPLSEEGRFVQDPAAGWVENSSAAASSLLVNHGRYQWKSTAWRRPGWEYLIVYQLHGSRFTSRHGNGVSPLQQVALEVGESAGYLRSLGATALLLLPVNEFAGDRSWGYDPSFFYAVEESYGGPQALKELVDLCHQNGMAVLLDVVFNHAGTVDNILWQTARDSFFDGDTRWGSLINFDHPQCRHFFEQNLLYWMNDYRIDGFRFDHTKTIIEGGNASYDYIRSPGSGGGWEFLHALRAGAKGADPQCLFVAEHLPNEPKVTNYGGPMDSQWGDDFHDRLVGLCKGEDQISRFGEAVRFNMPPTCQQWFNITLYPESHDEVGNVNDRIANVGGFGRGLRLNKVAAAATLIGRGIPMWFMGAESGETAQFQFGAEDTLDLDRYRDDANAARLRDWWKAMVGLRRGNPKLQGPAPVAVHYLEKGVLAFSRGNGAEFFTILNFNDYPLTRNLASMNLPPGEYRELWNSTWPAFQVEFEDEHGNGGRDARLHGGWKVNVPDNGVVVLERV